MDITNTTFLGSNHHTLDVLLRRERPYYWDQGKSVFNGIAHQKVVLSNDPSHTQQLTGNDIVLPFGHPS